MKKFWASALIAGSLFFMPVANAEIKTYEGTEEYLMSEFETIDIAKQRAKQKAERVAQEQAGVYISSYSETKDFELVKDEVISIACGILSVIDVKYDVKPLDNANGFLIRATVKANINTDDVNKFLNKSAQEKSAIVMQNKELQAAIAEQDATIEKLKAQIETLKSEGKLSGKLEREKISQEVAAEDKIFQANLKLEEAQKNFYNRNYEAAIKLSDEAIELNPNSARAYGGRGGAYGVLNQPQKTIADCTKAIELDQNYAMAYNNRGTAYGKLGDYQQALMDFNKAIELDPTLALAYNNRGSTLLFLGNGAQAFADLNKAIELNPKLDLAYANLGMYYLSAQNFSVAVANFDKAIKLNPKLAAAYHFRAMSYQATGQFSKAQADFAKARELGYQG